VTVDPLVRLGANVKARRKALKLTQEEAAWRAGMDRSYWGRIERARVDPGVRMTACVAAALTTTPADLVADVGEEYGGRCVL
jgi:transcriptional regulator with XRE-family HTH domain